MHKIAELSSKVKKMSQEVDQYFIDNGFDIEELRCGNGRSLEELEYGNDITRKIKKKNGEELIKKADNICYQDNNFFGTLSLYGVVQEKDIIHNILFPQLE